MANSVTSGENKEYATVNAAPSATGYWTNPIGFRTKKIAYAYFSIRGTGVAVVTLQFKCEGDEDWTDFNNDGTAFVTGDRKIVEGNAANVLWRAGVKQANYTSGSITFGFDW